MSVIFETHAHYEDEAFDEDRDELIKSLPESGIGYVANVGSSIATCHRTVELIKYYDYMYGALGIHPGEIHEVTDDDMKWIETEAKTNPKIVSVGEIGLDYHYGKDDKEIQKDFFEKQLDMAVRLDKPVIIHSREAAKDTYDIMREHDAGKAGGVVHCFSYHKEEAAKYLDMGFYIGIGGAATFKNNEKTREVIAYTPLDRILLETDCPYMAPVPHRGTRNSSLNLPLVAECIAQVKRIAYDTVVEATYENARRMYRI